MIEGLIEIIAEFVFELFLQILVEVGAELGFESIRAAVKDRKPANPFLAAFGLFLLGGLTSVLIFLFLHHRLMPAPIIPGISLLLAPLCAGGFMHLFGLWRRKNGSKPTFMATFAGGASFAFGMAFVRWALFHIQ